MVQAGNPFVLLEDTIRGRCIRHFGTRIEYFCEASHMLFAWKTLTVGKVIERYLDVLLKGNTPLSDVCKGSAENILATQYILHDVQSILLTVVKFLTLASR